EEILRGHVGEAIAVILAMQEPHTRQRVEQDACASLVELQGARGLDHRRWLAGGEGLEDIESERGVDDAADLQTPHQRLNVLLCTDHHWCAPRLVVTCGRPSPGRWARPDRPPDLRSFSPRDGVARAPGRARPAGGLAYRARAGPRALERVPRSRSDARARWFRKSRGRRTRPRSAPSAPARA